MAPKGQSSETGRPPFNFVNVEAALGGTAHSIADLAPYVAGKTGTSDDENDAWFVGFTNEMTVAVWIGYDNAHGKRRTLGGGATGGSVALPNFEPVIRAVWNDIAPRTALAPPSPEAKRDLSCAWVDADSGEVRRRGTRTTSECLRTDGEGRVLHTRMALLEPGETRHAKKKQNIEEAPAKKTASRERHHRYASERIPTQVRQVAPQWGFFGGGDLVVDGSAPPRNMAAGFGDADRGVGR